MKLRSVVEITLLTYTACSMAQQPNTVPKVWHSANTKASADNRRPIGTVTMLRDRTIILALRAETGLNLPAIQLRSSRTPSR
jgi:hypothetical protein